jgi:pantothenate kinase type III
MLNSSGIQARADHRRGDPGTVVPAALYHDVRRLARDWLDVWSHWLPAPRSTGVLRSKIDNPDEVGTDPDNSTLTAMSVIWQTDGDYRFRHRHHIRCGGS